VRYLFLSNVSKNFSSKSLPKFPFNCFFVFVTSARFNRGKVFAFPLFCDFPISMKIGFF
jgi:hypothetical protein